MGAYLSPTEVTTMGMPLRLFLGSFATLAVALLSGCPDPAGKFDDFNQRWCTDENIRETFSYCTGCTEDAQCGGPESGWVCDGGSCTTGCRGSGGNSCQPGVECSSTDGSVGKCAIGCDGPPAMVGEADGLYFFALVPPQSPTRPAPLLATLTSSTEGATGFSFTLELQPVDATDRMTLVGDPFTVGPFDVNGDGSFEADWGPIAVPGETNPLTASILEANIVTLGALCAGGGDVCGIASGQITSPVMLDIAGSTFYMERIEDIADHTEPVLLNCAGDQGNEL